MTVFYLIRHGHTSHTGHRLTGRQPGVHLTEDGRIQASAVAERLASVKLAAVYASPIERTVETARPIAHRHGLRVVTRAALGEVDYGNWTNRSFRSLTRTRLWERVQRFPSAARFPEGETLWETQTRALDEIERMRVDHPKAAVCCVSHADVIKLVAAHYLGTHIDLFQRIVVDPGSISVVAVGDDGPRVLALNSIPSPK